MNYIESNIVGRMNLPLVLNDRGLTGTAVEIGTYLGIYAADFLTRWKGDKFVTIDDYGTHRLIGGDRAIHQQEAAERLAFFGLRCQMFPMNSVHAAVKFDDKSLDFIHIDGDHDYDSCAKDIAAWWPKMKPGSLFTGHDYCKHFQGIVDSVHEHAKAVGLPVHVIRERCGHNTWMIEVPK